MEWLGTQYATERLVAGDLSPTPTIRESIAGSQHHVRYSTTFSTTYIEDHETAKIALAICHRNEDKTAVGADEEVARTEEAAMINAAARCNVSFSLWN